MSFVVIVWQPGGVVDDEVFVGPFRAVDTAAAAGKRIERAGAERGLENMSEEEMEKWQASVDG